RRQSAGRIAEITTDLPVSGTNKQTNFPVPGRSLWQAGIALTRLTSRSCGSRVGYWHLRVQTVRETSSAYAYCILRLQTCAHGGRNGLAGQSGTWRHAQELIGPSPVERFAGADQCGAGEDPIS